MYEIQEEQVKQLELILQEMPLKWGLPILNLLNTHLTKQEVKETVTNPIKK